MKRNRQHNAPPTDLSKNQDTLAWQDFFTEARRLAGVARQRRSRNQQP